MGSPAIAGYSWCSTGATVSAPLTAGFLLECDSAAARSYRSRLARPGCWPGIRQAGCLCEFRSAGGVAVQRRAPGDFPAMPWPVSSSGRKLGSSGAFHGNADAITPVRRAESPPRRVPRFLRGHSVFLQLLLAHGRVKFSSSSKVAVELPATE